MDTVAAFNTELSGLYDSKPPISKAKMTSITRSAMKAIKFYKHVVQSVEKFILKCKQEYKIPGLYVIDSIVRQSRHQFGAEKDVFAPRFARNMQTTFANLFQCSPEDKSKIIRVLNLWQKNNVFAPEVIQPLFDLADPNHPIYQNQGTNQGTSNSNGLTQESPVINMIDEGHTMSSDISGPLSVMSNQNQFDSSTIRQLQQLQQILMRQTNNEPVASTSNNAVNDSVKFNKKLLDYDYGEDEDDDKNQSPRQNQSSSSLDNSNISHLLNDPNVLRQLQNLQKLKQQEEKQSKLTEMRLQEEAFEKQLANMLKKLPFANECDLKDSQMYGLHGQNLNAMIQQQQSTANMMASSSHDNHDPEVEFVSDDNNKVEVINLDGNSRSPSVDRDRYKRRRSRSRSRDRSGRRRRSRSRSRSPRNRRRGSSRDRDRNSKDKEKERERKRKGLPDIKREHLSVCSTTLWVGHLSKLVQQEELSDTFAKYGDIVSIDMIHPRGCAFIVMLRRQDAFKAMAGLKNHKLHGRAITLSWAAGKGVKNKEWKDYWDLDLGVSYIPWSKLDMSTNFDQLEEGGTFDEDTMPPWMAEKLKKDAQNKDTNQANMLVGQIPNLTMFNMDTTQPPPSGQMMVGVPPMLSAFPGAVPRFMPPMMTQNLGLPLGVPPPMNGQMLISQPGMVPGMSASMNLDKPPPSAANANFMGYFPPIPQAPPIPQQTSLQSSSTANNSDDHMDIEMEDEMPNAKIPSLMSPIFNRPPPQMYNNQTAISGQEYPNSDSGNAMLDGRNNIREQGNDRDRDIRGRGRDRERDNRSRMGNRDNNRRSGNDYDKNQRWPNHRGNSKDNDMGRTDSRERNERVRDRNDRDKPLHDRLRDMAADGRAADFNNSRNVQWREGMPPHSFPNNNAYGNDRRQLNVSGPLPTLEDIRVPVPLDNLRGPNVAAGNNKSHQGRGFDFNRGGDDFERRQMNVGQHNRDFYHQNRFGSPGLIRNNVQQFGPRNNSSIFMWGPRGGPNNDRQYYDRDGCPDNNQNRNDRMRGMPSGSDGRRGPRQNWKDNDRNNRNFDNQRDRKSSRWANSPKSIASEENWNPDNVQLPTKRSAKRSKADDVNDMNDSNEVSTSGLPQTEPICNDSPNANFDKDDIESSNRNKINSFSMKFGNNNTNKSSDATVDSSNNDNNQTSKNDVNTTPLYDEPNDELTLSSKNISNTIEANSTQTIIEQDTPIKQNQTINNENLPSNEIETN